MFNFRRNDDGDVSARSSLSSLRGGESEDYVRAIRDCISYTAKRHIKGESGPPSVKGYATVKYGGARPDKPWQRKDAARTRGGGGG